MRLTNSAVVMYNGYKYIDEAAMKEQFLAADREYKKARQKRNAAAFADFATNLLSIVGHNKGLRYNVAGSPLTANAASDFDKAQERYRRALVDYKGVIAENNLKKSIAVNKADLFVTPKPKFLTATSYTPANKYKPWMVNGKRGNINDIKIPVWHINNKK